MSISFPVRMVPERTANMTIATPSLNSDSPAILTSIDLGAPTERRILNTAIGSVGEMIVPNKRQYKKNIGRFLEVKINSGEFYKGKLKSFNNDFIEINSKVREPKKKGRGSSTVEKLKLIKLDEISNAKVVI